MKKLFIVADSPGAADFIAPVIPRLTARFECSIIAVKNSPAVILSKYHPIRIEDEREAERLFEVIKPDAVIVGTSSLVKGPYVVKIITRDAALKKLPIICYQDYWANHRALMNKEVMDLWQVILAPDALAKKFLLEDDYKGKIVVTGHPGFEKFSAIDIAKRRGAVRREYAVPDDSFFILYAGAGTPYGAEWDTITFKFFLDAVSKMKERSIIIASSHPRDEDPQRYRKLAMERKMSVLNRGVHESSDDLLAGVDVVVGMYATALIHACYLRIPAVSILLPNAGKVRLKDVHLSDFPPNEAGATIGVYESVAEQLAEVFKRIQTDAEFRNDLRGAQEHFLPRFVDPPSQLAAQAIENFLTNEL